MHSLPVGWLWSLIQKVFANTHTEQTSHCPIKKISVESTL